MKTKTKLFKTKRGYESFEKPENLFSLNVIHCTLSSAMTRHSHFGPRDFRFVCFSFLKILLTFIQT